MSDKTQWTYHFHAEAYGPAGQVSHRDGLIHSNRPIRSEEDFKKTRENIREEMEGSPLRITVCSFTLLHGPEVPQ